MGEPKRVTSFLYAKVEEHAHGCVQATINLVEKLEREFQKSENNLETKNIKDMITYFTDQYTKTPRRDAVFRYFAAAVIYAQTMKQSFQKSQDFAKIKMDLDSTSSSSDTENEEEEYAEGLQELQKSSRFNIGFLNKVAGEILEELADYSCMQLHYDKLKDKTKEEKRKEKRKFLKTSRGRLSSNQPVGNTPFLTVFTSGKKEVSVRRGFELCRDNHSLSQKITSGREELNELPVRYYHNGIYHNNRSIENEKFIDIIDELEIHERIFKGKYVTFLHIDRNDTNRFKTTIHVDLIDHEVKGMQKGVKNEDLEHLAGRKLDEEKKVTTNSYKEEDLLITFFAETLFTSPKQFNSKRKYYEDCDGKEKGCVEPATSAENGHDFLASETNSSTYSDEEEKIRKQDEKLRQAFEVWSGEQMKSFVNKKSKMYIGFCFGTLLDVGYSSPNFVTGYRNVMLLALTRGFIKLYDNLTNEKKHIDPYYEDEPDKEEEQDEEKKLFIFPTRFVTRRESYGLETRIIDNSVLEVITDKKPPYNLAYIGSNSSGIIIKINRPPVGLFFTGIVFVITAALLGYLHYSSEDLKKPKDYIRAIGPVIELWGAMLAFCFLIVTIIYKQWNFVDMINSRKRCPSLKELIQAIKHARKPRGFFDFFRSKHTLDKIEAIKLCATIPNPEQIFSYHNSCAFTDAGQGEFEIDEDIEMKELEKAGYIFGVNYHGDPIVCDPKRSIRKIHFRLCEKNRCISKCFCAAKPIHIGSQHHLQTKSIFKLSYENRLVGARKSYGLENLL